MILANQNKSMEGQRMDKIMNDCKLRMFIEELRDCLERCGRYWWVR